MSYIRDFTAVWKCVPFCSDPTEFRSPLPWVTLYKFPNQQNSGNSQIMMGQTYPATRKLILAITGNQFIILVKLFKSSCSPFYCIWIQKKWSPMTKLHNWNMLTAHFFFKSCQWPKSFCCKQKKSRITWTWMMKCECGHESVVFGVAFVMAVISLIYVDGLVQENT